MTCDSFTLFSNSWVNQNTYHFSPFLYLKNRLTLYMSESQHTTAVKSFSAATFCKALGCSCKWSKFHSRTRTIPLLFSAGINAYSLVGLRQLKIRAAICHRTLVQLNFRSILSTLRLFLIHYLATLRKAEFFVDFVCPLYTTILSMGITQAILQLFRLYSYRRVRFCKQNPSFCRAVCRNILVFVFISRNKDCFILFFWLPTKPFRVHRS